MAKTKTVKATKPPKEELSSKGASLFDILNFLTSQKRSYESLSEADIKQISPYMINRFISMNSDLLPIVNEFQQYTSSGILSPREVYKLYLDILPKSKMFFKYVTGRKDEKYDVKLIEIISKHLQCSKKETLEYLEILDNNPDRKSILTSLLTKYAIPEKEINKII